jgi:hypothetical protein
MRPRGRRRSKQEKTASTRALEQYIARRQQQQVDALVGKA